MFRVSTVLASCALTLVAAASAQSAGNIRMAQHPALSSDGANLFFAYHDDIWTVPSEGGSARRLTFDDGRDANPVLSPDGKQLAFVSDRTGSPQVFVMPAEGGKPRQVTHFTEGYIIEAWMPSGNALLVSSSRDHFWRNSQRFFIVNTEEVEAEKLVFDAYGHDASISADGKKLLFVREGERWWRKGYVGSRAAQIWMYDMESSEFTEVLKKDTECRTPVWMPDGKGFYYVGAESGSFNLMRYMFATGKSESLTSFGDDSVVDPVISADGKTAVFRQLFDFYRLDLSRKSSPKKIEITESLDREDEPLVRRTLDKATQVAFTDDGLEMAFVAGGDIWVMDTILREPKRVTNTTDFEANVVFSRDGKTLYYTTTHDGQPDIWKATRSDEDQYWWQNQSFELKNVTSDAETESGLRLLPDGKQMSYVRGLGDLWVMNLENNQSKKIFDGFLPPDYDFSPDSKWIVYAQADDDFNYDVWVKPLDGHQPAVNISMHPDNESDVAWSADGKLIAFTGRRMDDEVDIYYVWLQNEDEDKTSRSRKMQLALEALNKARKKPTARPTTTKPAATPTPPKGTQAPPKPEPAKAAAAKPASEKPAASSSGMKIDFKNIHERLHRISISNSSESNLFFSATGSKLTFTASVGGKRGTYTVDFPKSMTPKLLSATTGSSARWLKSNKIVWLANGVPGSLSSTGAAASYAFKARQDFLATDRFRAAFDASWLSMRDWWYDDRFNNRNWNSVRRKYIEIASETRDTRTLTDLVSMMLGELNGSHLGFRTASSRSSSGGWSISTPHLGVRFDQQFKGPGLRIADVIPEGPADKSQSKLEAGEVILQIDGVSVDPQMNLAKLLNGPLDRDITLKVKKDDEERTVTMRPTTYSAVRSLLYQKWMDDNRAMVDKMSDGKVGYLHITQMSWPSFLEFERELYAVGYGKDGLVIDVRENGGGFTTDHLLTALTQPVHAVTVPRDGGKGYPHDRMVYATWHKPIIVLCNQNSFSNAEIFSHAIKGLKRGKVVGVPTAGGVISTGSTTIMDIGTLRRPFRGWFVTSTGRDMELNGAVPDIVKWPLPGELPAGKDTQLELAVSQLKKDIRRYLRNPPPPIKKASELRAGE